MHSPRNRTVRSNNDKDGSRFPDRNSSESRRSSSSNNGSSAKHPYSSFTRSHRNRSRVREKEKPFSDDIWDHHGSFDPLASILTSGVERIGFRRSQSLVSRQPTVEDSKKSSSSSGIRKSDFGKDFPSLGNEEKRDTTGNCRVLSTGSSSAVQCLPMGNSGYLGGERWTSALAEVPAILANNGVGHSQNVVTSCAVGLNMAEALSQSPARVRAAPQLPDKSQRLEELAIKQSRQLIPMTPTMPKPLSLSSGDKSKQSKLAVKTSDPSKVALPQPHSPHLSNHSRPDSPSTTTSHFGKFLVLKPVRENASISTGDANCKVLNGHIANSPSTPTASMSPNNSTVSALEEKVNALSLSSKPNVEKKSPHSLAQSRSEFFNLMRRKNSRNAKTALSGSGLTVSSPGAEIIKERESPSLLQNGSQSICNGNGHYGHEKSENFSDVGEKNLLCNGQISPEEEEAAFLRSLGWEENGGEDEGLTEEEINAFYQEYMNRRPSLKVCVSSQPKGSTLSAISGSESSSSDSEA
ncbi:hypothetical protein PHJA_000903900 [Phtheirospermum japonicum]|uniref:Uncharacterized protein n=1 Tax=Phtheirospermum japonicum TaxID=374723 RepID=A0A830BNA5_9LAMI|nr:hypothetical protein PHJA_000903900 [Phtheirospermum japonicum]